MKKNKIKIAGVLAVTLVTFISKVNAANLPSFNDEIYELNWNQTVLADKIKSTIKLSDDTFPSYFGGIYISDDSKNVVVQIVKDNIPNEDSEEFKKYNRITQMNDNIIIEYVNNSFTELNNLNDLISDTLTLNPDKTLNVIANHIDVKNNKVEIKINDDNKTLSKTRIANAINNDKKELNNLESLISVNYEKDIDTTYATTLYAGQSINMKDGTCSMGFRTRYNDKDGYLTAGHCGQVGDSVQTGTIKYRAFGDNGDYAFVQTKSTWTPSNTLAFAKPPLPSQYSTLAVITNYCPTVSVGTLIAKSGATTYYTEGKVLTLNYTSTYGVKGLVTTDAQSAAGDSGGAVFIPRKDSQGGSMPVGILSGGRQGSNNSMYFTDFSKMLPVFQINRY